MNQQKQSFLVQSWIKFPNPKNIFSEQTLLFSCFAFFAIAGGA